MIGICQGRAVARRIIGTVCVILLLGLYVGCAQACMVCIPFPQKTAIDELLDAEVVALARENPQAPFSYRVHELLQGSLDDVAVQLFIDSSTRRRLALNPDRSVVLVKRKAGADADSGDWRSLGYASPAYEALLRDVIEIAPIWQEQDSASSRHAYFMQYLGHADRRLRETAYLEVGRAPYDTIREADAYVEPARVHAFLDDPLYLEWRRLYILLLGVDANDADAARIRNSMNSLARFDQSLNLSAWATALIEVDGEAAIDWLERHYIGNSARDTTSVLETLKALSVHGSRPLARLRPRIAESYAVLVETHPQLSGWAARELTAWQDWRLAEPLAALRSANADLDSASRYAIDYYLERAGARRQ